MNRRFSVTTSVVAGALHGSTGALALPLRLDRSDDGDERGEAGEGAHRSISVVTERAIFALWRKQSIPEALMLAAGMWRARQDSNLRPPA